MSLTLQEAVDAMMQQFIEGWGAPNQDVDFDDIDSDFKPPDDRPWARVSIRHNLGYQASLGGTSDGTIGGKPTSLFRREGIIFIQVFYLFGDGLVNLRGRCQEVMDAFEGRRAGGVWFRRVRVNEVPLGDDKWRQANVIVEFEYDQVK